MNCGRQPGGQDASRLGVCPASVHAILDGIHNGNNAGRACWVMDDTQCSTAAKESSARKFAGCWKCDFYHLVRNEEKSSPHGFVETYSEMMKILTKSR